MDIVTFSTKVLSFNQLLNALLNQGGCRLKASSQMSCHLAGFSSPRLVCSTLAHACFTGTKGDIPNKHPLYKVHLYKSHNRLHQLQKKLQALKMQCTSNATSIDSLTVCIQLTQSLWQQKRELLSYCGTVTKRKTDTCDSWKIHQA